MTDPHRHASQPKLISRLKRAEGHLRSVGAVIEERRPRRDVATQLQTVESAVRNVTPALIHDHVDHYHVDHCLDAEGSDHNRAELEAMTRFH